jgi:pimeloyl-ACP methyl ester carboxylesterase
MSENVPLFYKRVSQSRAVGSRDRRAAWILPSSGGSRVALRLALGFPDVFRGAFLNAGSDPIGDAQTPLPPAELFSRFQEMTRLAARIGMD